MTGFVVHGHILFVAFAQFFFVLPIHHSRFYCDKEAY